MRFGMRWLLVLGALLLVGTGPAWAQAISGVAAQTGFRVAGVVVDSVSGQPVSRADVSLQPLAGPDAEDVEARKVVTGGDGRFEFMVASAGHYVLLADRKGYVQQAYKQHGTFSTGIVVGENAKADELRFEITPDASIAGQVLDEMSEPARSAQVLLLRQAHVNGRRRTVLAGETGTDDLGRYRFGHVSRGTYFVAISTKPWYTGGMIRARHMAGRSERLHSEDVNTDVVYPTTFFPSAVDFGAATPIVLHPGDTATANVSLAPVAAIHFTFRSNGGDGQEQLSVQSATQIIADGVEERLSLQTSTSGETTEIEGLPPGRIELGWVATKGNETTRRTQSYLLGTAGQIENLDDGGTASVKGTIQLEPRMSSSIPIVVLRSTETNTDLRVMTEYQANGEYSFSRELAAGTYELFLPRAPQASFGIAASGAKVTGTTVEILAGQNVELKISASLGTGKVTGVAMKDGKAMDGVMVLLVPPDVEHAGNLLRVDQSDSDGSFNLAQVVPGEYTVVGIEGAWDAEWGSTEFLRRFLARGEKVEIGVGEVRKVRVEVTK